MKHYRGRMKRPPFRIEQSGWVFTRQDEASGRTDVFLEKNNKLGTGLNMDETFIVKHLHSGFQFRFSGYDAIVKWHEENHPDPHAPPSNYPSYDSPLPLSSGFDSTYVGTTMLEKPGEDPKIIFLKWEDVEFTELYEEIQWTDKFRQVCGVPFNCGYPVLDANGKVKRQYKRIRVPFHLDLPEASLNFQRTMYYDCSFYLPGNSVGQLDLVLTRSGWFISLLHSFKRENDRARRLREMTMHCKFKDNIVYREINERQDKRFNAISPEKGKTLDEMCLHFHEVKRLVVEEVSLGGSPSCLVRDTIRHKSLTVEELNDKVFKAVEISDEKVAWFLCNRGEIIQRIKAQTSTDIQIVPYFHHPLAYGRGIRGECWKDIFGNLRKAYISGSSSDDVDRAKNHLVDDKSQSSRGPLSNEVIINVCKCERKFFCLVKEEEKEEEKKVLANVV